MDSKDYIYIYVYMNFSIPYGLCKKCPELVSLTILQVVPSQLVVVQ